MAPYTQENRIVRIDSPFGEEVLVHTLKGEERLSSLFRFDLDLYSENPDLAAEDIVGEPVGLEIELGPEDATITRVVHGLVSRFSFESSKGEGYVYRAELVPWLWLFGQRTDCRIFQALNALEIMQDMLGDLTETDLETTLQPPDHATRDYCVQYRETTMHFLQRLCEQEGWFFFSRHEEGRDVLVLTDGDQQGSDCPELESELRYVGTEEHEFDPHLMITKWNRRQVLHPGSLALADYNYADPRTRLLASATTSVSVGANDRLELYDYPGEFVKLGEPDGPKLDYGEAWAELRMKEEEAAAVQVEGAGTCHEFQPGVRFSLVNHPREAENDTYLVTRVTHEIGQPIEMGGGGGGGGGSNSYQNTFTCLPAATPYVPRRRTPKPYVRGPQTAVVVGDEGADPNDVRIDDQGRVKVRFHWDRNEDAGGEPTCWVRVSQGWAGAGWGAQFHPRVGHEVVVSFLEGDPDRPLITGRVYNAVNTIPYDTPSQGGIKSRSTPGGGAEDYNEIRFEDAADEEKLLIHAQKDNILEVENDDTQTVGNDRNIEVKNNHGEAITNNMTIDVGGSLTETVTVNYSENVGAAMELTVGGAFALSVGGVYGVEVSGNQDVQVGESATLKISGNEDKEVGESATLSVGGDLTEDVGGAHQLNVSDALAVKAKKIAIEADDEVSFKTGSAEITLKKSGDITLKGKKLELKGSGDIILKGMNIKGN